MTQGFQRFTKRHASVLGVLIGLAVVSSILLYAGCGMVSRPNTPANPAPTPTPTPTPTPDTLRPTSAITSPTTGATVLTETTVTISGTASDAGGGSVARVDVSVDGGATYSAATGTTAWSFSWTPTTPGQATIRSRAVDNSGNVQDPPAEITVTVIKDTTPPTSTITSPQAGAVVLTGAAVTIIGAASDAGGGSVAGVEVSVDGGSTYNKATGTTAWSYTWTPTTPGQATIRSRAVDNSGNAQDPPAEISVRVSLAIRVPSDRPTIQAAIEVANSGDTVLAAAGTYFENINFKGKAITVTSESGPKDTIIDGGNADSVVLFVSGEGRDSALNGFTLQNGRASSDRLDTGGGVVIQGSSPMITNNKITNNHACEGAGIGILGINAGSPLIQLNTITGNVNDACHGGGGGGISISGEGSVEILDNVISDNVNAAGGGIYMPAGKITATIKRNVIKGNRVPVPGDGGGEGGGIYMANEASALIVQYLITGNQAFEGGGIYWASVKIVLVNNTIADNDGSTFGSGIFAIGINSGLQLTNNIIVAKPTQSGLYCDSFNDQNPPIIRSNNIFSSAGMAYGGACPDMTGTEGNISADPQFTNSAQGDYHLQVWSPSIDAGYNTAPNLPDTDLDGDPRILDGDGDGTAIIDMGVDEILLPPGFRWPISTIRSPGQGATVSTGTMVSITGLAKDAAGGTVDRVEVSVDGGVTWNAAIGTTVWSYDWTPATPGPATIKSRAVTGSGNVQDPPAEIAVTVRTPVFIKAPSAVYPTIQSAIDVAGYGDTVLVAPGTYFEHINFRGKAITVRSESGQPKDTIIDGGSANPVVSFISGEGRGSSLNGFTLQNGRASIANQGFVYGGGIVIQESSPMITNNVITNNHACNGAGVGILSGSPLIQGNTITNNVSNLCSLGGGSGISIQGTSFVEILENEISNNGMVDVRSLGGGIYMSGAGTLIIKRNIIKGNHVSDGSGGGVYLSNRSETLIVQNLITGNQAGVGAGLSWAANFSQGFTLVNNTIADNDATQFGSGIFADGFGTQSELTNNIIVAKPAQSGFYCQPFANQNPPIIRSNNIFSSGGKAYDGSSCSDMTGKNGNISADPLFANLTQGDYHLQLGSHSIDTGDNSAPNLPDTDLDKHPRIMDGDGDGTPTVDMGVYEFLAPPSSDGKSHEESGSLNLRPSAAPPAPSKPLAPNLRPDRRNRMKRAFHPAVLAVLDSLPGRLKPVLYLGF
jgi:parallel beta-helix repeat protein